MNSNFIFSSLLTIIFACNVSSQFCTPPSDNTCQNHGYCDVLAGWTCQCAGTTSGTTCGTSNTAIMQHNLVYTFSWNFVAKILNILSEFLLARRWFMVPQRQNLDEMQAKRKLLAMIHSNNLSYCNNLMFFLHSDPDDCLPTNPCAGNADCTDGIMGPVCTCQSGWTGANCDMLLDCTPGKWLSGH